MQEEEAGGSASAIEHSPESGGSRAGSVEQGPNSSHGSSGNSKHESPAKDCHNVVKSSGEGLEGRGNLCHAHQIGTRYARRSMNSVACQTDATDEFHSLLRPTFTSCSKSIAIDQSATSSSSSDGVLRLMIQNFPNMNDTVKGPSKKISGVHWRIMVMPRQHVVQKKGTQKCLGFFLQCCPDAYSDSWSCSASAELRLFSQKPGVPHFTRKTNHVYTAKENDWGYSCFMTWTDILEESQGYIKDDKVILEVTVKADPPKNILTHEEFRKNINQWQELAELQFSRGMIDLAIEANAQALKFCKERDLECKERLEKQKKFFVEKKLVESIQRIEKKGKDHCVKTDDDSNAQNALRLAIQSNTQKINGGKVKGTTKKDRKTRPSTPPGNPPNRNADAAKLNADNQLIGNFSKAALCSLSVCQTPWIKRGKEEDAYSSVAKQIEDLGLDKIDPSAVEKDALVMRYVSEQFKLLSMAQKEGLWQNQGKWRFTPLDAELQRQFIIKKAQVFVEMYCKRIQRGENLISTDCEDLPKMLLSILWEGDRMETRLSIIDKEARFLDAKIRLFWNVEEQFEGAWFPLEDDLSFSDQGSFSDSDSASGEGPRNKRSRNDLDCDNCIQERLDLLSIKEMGVQTSDMQCQTDPITETVVVSEKDAKKTDSEVRTNNPVSPNARATPRRPIKSAAKKKPTPHPILSAMPPKMFEPCAQRSTKASETKVDSTNTSSSPTEDSPLGDLVDASQFVEGMGEGGASCPPILPMEFAMKFYMEQELQPPNDELDEQLSDCGKPTHLDVKMEESFRAMMGKVWTMLKAGDDKMLRGSPMGANMNSFDGIVGPGEMFHPDQVKAALTMIAANCMNAKRIGERLKDFMSEIDKKSKSKDIQNALHTLCKLGDLVNAVGEEDDDTTGLLPCDERRHVGEEYLLSRHLVRLENLRRKADKYQHYIHVKDSEKLRNAVAAIETKMQQHEKDKQKLQSTIDEMKKEKEKMEKTHAKTSGDLRLEKESKEKLNVQLRDKNKEIKKLEKKVKDLMAAVDDKEEMKDKIEQLQKELAASQKKLQDESTRSKREIQTKEDMKKHLQQELASRDSELNRMNQTLDDRNVTVKKLESQLAAEKRSSHTSLVTQTERAKKVEIQFLELQLETGMKKLERAREDALKNMKDMEEAANNRARSSTEQQAFAASRDEWKAKSEEIRVLIQQAKTEFGSQMEAIKNGKALSQLPKLTVAKPPPPAKILPIPPANVAAPVIPELKPTPGVIGSRSTSSAAQLPTPIGSAISPKSKAPGSPIQKPVAAVASQPQTSSPARHPGAIGTRLPTSNGVDSAPPSQQPQQPQPQQPATSNAAPPAGSGPSWHWNDYNFGDSILPGNRSFGSLTGDYPPSSVGNNQPTPSTSSASRDLNGWSTEDNWNKNGIQSNAYLGSFAAAPGTPSQQSSHYLPQASTWEERRPAPQPAQSRYAMILEKLAETFRGIPQTKLVELANEYCTTYKTNLSTVPIETAIQLLQNHILTKLKQEQEAAPRRLIASQLQPPPGAAPGYLSMGSLLGLDSSRQTPNQMMGTYNPLLDQPMLNGDMSRNNLGNDKWGL